jgi:hypothetical protein
MKKILLHLLLLFPILPAVAQEHSATSPANKLDEYLNAGMEVAGVRAPYYNDEGELQAQLYGGYAKVLEGNVADVTNLRIDVFQDGEVFMTVFAPQCFTKIDDTGDNRFLEVYSEGEVLIDLEQMTISGRGFRFTSEKNQFEIENDSKVLVKESARDMNGVEL